MTTNRIVVSIVAMLLSLTVAAPVFSAEPVTIRVAYQPAPILDQQLKWMEKWAAEHNVNLVKVPLAYDVYVPRMTNNLLGPSSNYDLIWHNDGWGVLWCNYLTPLDDVPALQKVDPWLWDGVFTCDGKTTGVPFVETDAALFYRKDLIDSPPETWQEMVEISRRLQESGAVDWGYVGGLKYPHIWFSVYWTVLSNDANFFAPPFERDAAKLAESGWRTMVTHPRFIEAVEFWWDAMHEWEISPREMVNYDRTTADAIFMAGQAAFTFNDTTMYGTYNDPERSQIAGKVGIAPWPIGPQSTSRSAWRAAWAWAIPEKVDPEVKEVAKQLIDYLVGSEEVQIDLFRTTGGIPANLEVSRALEATDPLYRTFREASQAADQVVISEYYIPQWSRIMSAFSDHVTEALIGSRDEIPAVMERLDREIREIMSE